MIIVLFITVLYLATAIRRKGSLPESISETSYIWEQDCPNSSTSYLSAHTAYLFSLYCAITALLTIYPWYSAIGDYTRFLGVGGVLGILAAGATPFFRSSWQKPVHYGGGILVMTCWVLWMILNSFYIALVEVLGLACVLTCIKKQSWVLWFELAGLLGLSVVC
jgi:hypothetical protein